MERIGPHTLHHGDCLEALRAMPDNSIDAVVTDPPYGLGKPPPIRDLLRAWLADEDHDHLAGPGGFMGRAWDAMVPHPSVWTECCRVLKPGGHLIAFAGQRTADLMGVALRLGGLTIRDLGAWAYWSGFPKSLDVSKAIDRRRDDADQAAQACRWIADTAAAAGVTRRMVDEAFGSANICQQWFTYWTDRPVKPRVPTLEQVPTLLRVLGDPEVPPEIQRLLLDLNGRKGQPGAAWFEREVLGHRDSAGPFNGGNLFNTGSNDTTITAPATPAAQKWAGWGTALKPALEPWLLCRKPLAGTVAANVLEWGTGGLNIDGCRYPYDDPAWPGPSDDPGSVTQGLSQRIYGGGKGLRQDPSRYESPSGGRWPANVYYCPKASRAEREAGCGHLPARSGAETVDRAEGSAGLSNPRTGAGRTADTIRCFHPTVKPLALMRWLVRLVTPPGGVVLDPFAGSGTTLCAAALEGFTSVGCEREDDYLPIIRARLNHWRTLDPSEERPESADPQVRLF
jgi:DNA modification methylase